MDIEALIQAANVWPSKYNAEAEIQEMCVALVLDPAVESKHFGIVHTLATKHAPDLDIDRMLKDARIRRELGDIPHTAREFVELYMAHNLITIDPTGQARRDPSRVTATSPATFSVVDLTRLMRIKRDDLGLRFKDTSIGDVATNLVTEAGYRAIAEIRDAVFGPIFDDRRAEVLSDLEHLCGHLFQEEPRVAAAILRKFIHSVKRNMLDLPVGYHLMPVLVGGQGFGKTTFVDNRLLAPLGSLAKNTTFDEVTDKRVYDLFQRNYALILNEMQYASKADIDCIKNIITRLDFETRPLYANATITVRDRTTLIGTSNRDVREMINDEGMRRFAQLTCVEVESAEHKTRLHDLINVFDYLALWQALASTELVEFR
jgi:hypothetical protein